MMQDLTEEKEKELISNNKYACSKYSAIAIIIKAATLLGCNLAAQNRLHSNTVGNLNEIILKSVNQTVTRVEDPKVGVGEGSEIIGSSEKGKGCRGVCIEANFDYM